MSIRVFVLGLVAAVLFVGFEASAAETRADAIKPEHLACESSADCMLIGTGCMAVNKAHEKDYKDLGTCKNEPAPPFGKPHFLAGCVNNKCNAGERF